ncbi:MAG: DPP IV N-terminal domain-containing protein [Sphingobium sp.]
MTVAKMRCLTSFLLLLIAAAFSPAMAGASGASDVDARVARAQPFMSRELSAKVLNAGLTFHWIGEGDRFWFRKTLDGKNAFIVVDARTGEQQPLFDPVRMADALAAVGAGKAPIREASVSADARTITVGLSKVGATCRWPQLYDQCDMPVDRFECDLPVTRCEALSADPLGDTVASPDGKSVVRVVDNNLWLKDSVSGAERPLTSAGVKDFAYGTVHNQLETFAASRRRLGLPDPISGVLWSPDSRYILALRHDVRAVRDRLVLTEYLPPEGGPPVVHTQKLATAADAAYPPASLDIISVADGSIRHVNVDPHDFADMAVLYFVSGAVWWDMPHEAVWVVGARRGGMEQSLIRIGLRDGSNRTVIAEKADKPISLNMNMAFGAPNVRLLSGKPQAIWYSQRDGWGHLYLYDANSGRPIRQLTKGPWAVADIIHVDEASRTLYFTGVGNGKGDDPYYRHLYSVGLDGGQPRLLTPENADHVFAASYAASLMPGGSISPNGRYIIDDYSTNAQPDRYVLRRTDGTMVASIGEADVSALLQTGWRAPERFSVKAADGVTDLYGVLYKPRDFSPDRKYPVIEITYPSTSSKFAPSSFSQNFYGSAVMNANAFAELGAIVVSMDGRGTAYRSAAFQNAFLGTDDPTGSVDHVAAIRNLAASRPYMDISRVGVTGHSSGGDGSLRATMLHPDFFKVTVSGEAPTDYFGLPMDIAIERAFGMVPDTAEKKAYYERIAPINLVSRLKADNKVLMIYAGADEEVMLQQAFQIFDAFQKANFIYDELIIPDAGHWGGRGDYGVMRTLRYFAEHLGPPR